MTELEIKSAVRARDGYRCTECGMTSEQHIANHKKDLEVHRIIPGSKYTLEGCITLCCSCHGPKPRNYSGHDQSARKVVAFYPPKPYLDLLHQMRKPHKRSLTAELLLAIENHFRACGVEIPTVESQEE